MTYVSVGTCVITGDSLDTPIALDFSGVSAPSDGAAVTFFPTAASGNLTISFGSSSGQSNIIKVVTDTSVDDYGGGVYTHLAPSLAVPTLSFPTSNGFDHFPLARWCKMKMKLQLKKLR